MARPNAMRSIDAETGRPLRDLVGAAPPKPRGIKTDLAKPLASMAVIRGLYSGDQLSASDQWQTSTMRQYETRLDTLETARQAALGYKINTNRFSASTVGGIVGGNPKLDDHDRHATTGRAHRELTEQELVSGYLEGRDGRERAAIKNAIPSVKLSMVHQQPVTAGDRPFAHLTTFREANAPVTEARERDGAAFAYHRSRDTMLENKAKARKVGAKEYIHADQTSLHELDWMKPPGRTTLLGLPPAPAPPPHPAVVQGYRQGRHEQHINRTLNRSQLFFGNEPDRAVAFVPKGANPVPREAFSQSHRESKQIYETNVKFPQIRAAVTKQTIYPDWE
jgi:hypothetical protein